MSDSDPNDPAAETSRFQAFQESAEPAGGSPTAFRLLTLLAGLVVFVGLVLLLLR